MPSWSEYKPGAAKWITCVESQYYPDYLDDAQTLYESVLDRFAEMVEEAESSDQLLLNISEEADPPRGQLLRVFRKYVSPDTSVEMLKRKTKVREIIQDFSSRFRPVDEVRQKLRRRPTPDMAIMALLWEYKDRGQKGYELTGSFFTWFEQMFGEAFALKGPTGAGKDVMLNKELPRFEQKVPADVLISRMDGTPLVVGFARYDSDRGGAQEDDRTGGNHDKVTVIRRYAAGQNVPLKVLFINDGPGLLLGSMWNDYAALEASGEGDVMVCTLKMLDERLTRGWLES